MNLDIQNSFILNKVSETLETTGYLLPIAVFSALTLALLTQIYHDRAIFTPKHREFVYVPPAHPLVGNTINLIKHGVEGQHERGLQFALKSPINAFRQTILGVGSMIIVNRPEYLEWIQKTNFNNYDKGWLFRSRFVDLLGTNGVFVADGKVWLHTRKLASNIFSAFQFRTWIEHVLHGELDSVISILDQKASLKGDGSQVEMPELFFRYTLSSFSKMAFSTDVKCLTDSPDCLTEPVEFSQSFDFVQDVINKRFTNPAWQITEKFTAEGRKMRAAVKSIHDFANSIVKERVAERIASQKGDKSAEEKKEKRAIEKNGKDLLDLFMDHTLDEADLETMMLNFLIAGRDTTAQSLSWFFYELHLNPSHKEKIIKEVASVLGSPSDGVKLSYDQVKSLPYLNACISESIRLHPPVPRNGKVCKEADVIIPQGPNASNLPPIKIHKGELVGWSDWIMARLPAVWGEDCEEYKPSRFLKTDEDGNLQYVAPNQWQYHVFNAGPRLCLGMALATYEAVALSAALLPRYDFEWVQDQKATIPLDYESSVTLPCKPYLMKVSLRSD